MSRRKLFLVLDLRNQRLTVIVQRLNTGLFIKEKGKLTDVNQRQSMIQELLQHLQ